ncbi:MULTISPECIES: antiterminator LoaP [unclassified Niallia]|uniref:antiterminator LoaP n=1 Tax=unclassified Niallia TaxID=2837522 RepID=UPI0030FB0C14
MEWYAIFVESGKEETVQKLLKLHFGESFVAIIPKRIIPEKRNGRFINVVKTLFPGYVLIRTKINNSIHANVNSLPYIFRILENKGTCVPLEPKEISILLKLLNGQDIIELSKIDVNTNIKVISGPLFGLEGIIQKINKHTRRAKVFVNFAGRETLFDVGIEFLERV